MKSPSRDAEGLIQRRSDGSNGEEAGRAGKSAEVENGINVAVRSVDA